MRQHQPNINQPTNQFKEKYMSIYMVVQAIHTSRAGFRRLQPVKIDKHLNLYEDYTPAAQVASVIPAGYVIKQDKFKNYISTDELLKLTQEARN